MSLLKPMSIVFYILTVISAVTIAIPSPAKNDVAETAQCVSETIVQTSPTATTKIPKTKFIGEFKVTVYTPYDDGGKWGYQTSTGTKSKHLATCAVDPSIIPYGTVLRVFSENGINIECVAVDCGAFSGKKIDLFFDGTPAEAEAFARAFGEEAAVYIVKK